MKAFLDSQVLAVNKLSKTKVGALFMEAGTGKTRTAIELIKSTDTDFVLWFTPFQTKDNLRAEIDKWGGFDCDIYGIESIQNSDRIYLEISRKLEKATKATIVVDESLKIKNNTAKRTNRLLDLAKLSEYRLILNGTPLSKNLLDLWSQMQFLSPLILRMDMAEFKNTFCEYIKIEYRNPNRYKSYTKEFIKDYHNTKALYEMIEPFIFESKLSLSIGQKYIELPFVLSDQEKTEHEALKEKYLDNEVLQAMNNNIFLEITQKMMNNYSRSASKFDVLDKYLEGKYRKKVLIFANYIESQSVLKEYYPDIEVKSINKHCYGLNLQSFNTIVFWDKIFDYAKREQAEHRIFRTGQIDECTFVDLNANVGLDELVRNNITKKRSLLDIFKGMSKKQIIESL